MNNISSSCSSSSSSDTGKTLEEKQLNEILSPQEINKLYEKYKSFNPSFKIVKIKWNKQPTAKWEFYVWDNIFRGSNLINYIETITLEKLIKKIKELKND